MQIPKTGGPFPIGTTEASVLYLVHLLAEISFLASLKVFSLSGQLFEGPLPSATQRGGNRLLSDGDSPSFTPQGRVCASETALRSPLVCLVPVTSKPSTRSVGFQRSACLSILGTQSVCPHSDAILHWVTTDAIHCSPSYTGDSGLPFTMVTALPMSLARSFPTHKVTIINLLSLPTHLQLHDYTLK